MLVDIINDPGGKKSRVELLLSKYAGNTKTDGVSDNKKWQISWADVNHLTKWSLYLVEMTLYCVASRKLMREMV